MDQEEQNRPGYFAVIPADVRYDPKIPPNAKLLYGEISALIGKDGFCYASNTYFSELYGLTAKSISRLIGSLEKEKYISTILDHDKFGKVERRRIYLKVSLPDIQPVDNFGDTPPQNCPGGIPKKEEETNTRKTNIKRSSAKRPKECLSDEQLQEMSVDWIRKHGEAWSPKIKNALYQAMCNFYAPRETQRQTPGRTRASFTAMTNRLLRYTLMDSAAGEEKVSDPEQMIEMLERATNSKWLTVFKSDSPRSQAQAQEPEKEQVQWL